MRRTTVIVLCAAALLACAGPSALAADTDSHTVTVTVTAINEVGITGGDITLTIDTATPGSEPTDATDSTCSLAWTTNEATKKITVATNLAAPDFTLKVLATGVTGGTAAAEVTLSTTDTDFVTAISTTTGNCTLQYTASALIADGTGSDVHTVTYTLTAG